MSERKVFTYRDGEEAKKYIGKSGWFANSLEVVTTGRQVGHQEVTIGTLLNVYEFGFIFMSDVPDHHSFQFFSPDPEPIEKWVPFAAEDWREYMGKVVEARGSCGIHHRVVTRHTSHGVYLDGSFVSFQEFVDNWQNLDCSPCGKKVTE